MPIEPSHHQPREGREDAGPLSYRDPRRDLNPAPARQALVWAVQTALGLIALVAGLLTFAFSMDYRGFNTPMGTMGTFTALCVGGLLLVALIALAVRWRRTPQRRYCAVGIWIGIGVAALVEGICFGVNVR